MRLLPELSAAFSRSGVLAAALLMGSFSSGCASRRQAGEALVVAGALGVAGGSQAASKSMCTGQWCSPNKPSPAGAVVAAVGAGAALAGYGLILSEEGKDRPAKAPTAATAPTCCRLQRADPQPTSSSSDPEPTAPAQ